MGSLVSYVYQHGRDSVVSFDTGVRKEWEQLLTDVEVCDQVTERFCDACKELGYIDSFSVQR